MRYLVTFVLLLENGSRLTNKNNVSVIMSIVLIPDKLSYQSIHYVYKPRVLESSCSLLHIFITYILRVPFGPKFDFRTS